MAGVKKKTFLKPSAQTVDLWRRFRKNRSAVIGMIILALIILLVLCAPLFYDYESDAIEQNVYERLYPPFTEGHIFGTDDLGRDLMARLFFSGRN